MKKGLFLALLLACFAVIPLVAQESTTGRVWDHGDNVSEFSYRNATIYKIYDTRDAYVILYEKSGVRIGQVTVPKSWAQGNAGKLQFRNKPKGLSPYMTVVYRNGEFYKVLLTLPSNRLDSVWAVAPNGTQVDGANAETLEIEF